MLSAGNLRFSAVGKEKGSGVIREPVCVRACQRARGGIERIRAPYTYLMDINIEETIINTLTTLQPASPVCLVSVTA